jgi:guanosine-3',5'-bis(diphosphate) 3'-pyrophosphohydrolase
MPGARSVPSFLASRPRARQALAIARRAHAGQRRDADGAPFLTHPLAVARLLADIGADDDVVAAGLLHDALEKSDVRAADLRESVGERVERIVSALTEDPAIPGRTDRKRALSARVARSGSDAAAVYAADKVDKVRELRDLVRATGVATLLRADVRAKIEHYAMALAVAEHALGPHPLVDRLRGELAALRSVHGLRAPAPFGAVRVPVRS